MTPDSRRIASPRAVPNSSESTTGGSESPFDSMVTPMPRVMQLKTFMNFFLNSSLSTGPQSAPRMEPAMMHTLFATGPIISLIPC